MMNLIEFFDNNNLEYNNKTFVIGVSCGVDSMVLLDQFIKLYQNNIINIIVGFCNHKKRIESDDEEEFIVNFCKEKNILLYKTCFDFKNLKNNFQEEARNKRYQFFEDIILKTKANFLVLGHHATDLLETIIQRILRGSSLEGYSGFESVSVKENYTLIRPLISYSKKEIENYARNNSILYFQDKSNFEDLYTRNRIRKNIVKAFEEEETFSYSKILEFQKTIQDASLVLGNLVSDIIKKTVIFDENSFYFERKSFLENGQYLQIEILFKLLRKYSLSKNNILEIIKLIESKKQNLILVFKNKFTIKIVYKNIYFLGKIEFSSKQKINMSLNSFGSYKINDNLSIIVGKYSDNNIINLSNLWYNINGFPFTIRNVVSGDKIKTNAGYKKINDLFIDLKIKKEDREKALVCCDNKNEVLIIFGIKKSKVLENNEGEKILISLIELKKENG